MAIGTGTALATTNKHGTGTSSSSNKSWSSSSGTSYTTSYSTQKPVKVFEAHGIEFWGSAKSKLDDVYLTSTDLIVNCTGSAYVVKPFVKSSPTWLALPGSGKGPSGKAIASQLVLDWTDMSPPPTDVRMNFWEELLRQAKENGITRIICCCYAGQGRTGTALVSFMLAAGTIDDPGVGIEFLRETYNSKSVERDSQEIYLYNLLYDLEALFSELEDDED
jgi:hypothetical protein